MNNDDAIRLDELLLKFHSNVWMITVSPENSKDCELLEALGYIEIMSHDVEGFFIKLTDSGNKFRLTSSFREQVEEKQKKKEKEEFNVELTKRQLSAIKREPYLITWGIIATIISILLAFFK